MSELKSFGQLLREKRTESELSLRGLSASLGCSHVWLSEVERDQKPMGEKWWPQVARLVGTSIAELRAAHARTAPVTVTFHPVVSPLWPVFGRELERRLENDEMTEYLAAKLLEVVKRKRKR